MVWSVIDIQRRSMGVFRVGKTWTDKLMMYIAALFKSDALHKEYPKKVVTS
jgi:hypothetical protein